LTKDAGASRFSSSSLPKVILSYPKTVRRLISKILQRKVIVLIFYVVIVSGRLFEKVERD
jgi:hypothetical protein